ncbi:FecCD family ABC transporter permease [Antrihabitans sp. NCIMB 15449]|jgi:iron complex transport system permease protein|uniref:FecCD family ABC transporter permease n=1 Tax=Antrihabitans spumae TaxID=3373370 RepID=A0ABW7JPX5_9NOCA
MGANVKHCPQPDLQEKPADVTDRGPVPRRLRYTAAAIDAVVICAPLVIGFLIVQALRVDNGGTADRAVFGSIALLSAGALFVWNRGFRDGDAGQSLGKAATGLVIRDSTSGAPIGHRTALSTALSTGNRAGVEVVAERHAMDDGFSPLPRDDSIGATRKRRLGGLTVLAGLLCAVGLVSIAIGAQPLTIGEVWHAVFTPTGTAADEIVSALRVPRTMLGLLVGIALGVAGALIQGHTRNPLADAGLLGLNGGAAFAVVVAIHLFSLNAPSEYIWFAFVGSFGASVIVFGAASIGKGSATPLTLALAGAAVAFFLQAMTNAVVLLDGNALEAYRFWVVGEIAGRDTSVFWQILPFVIVGLVIAFAGTSGLNVLSLGDDVARSLGTNVALNRTMGIVAITLLCGAATAACGPIAFLGLVVPHVARTITGPDYRWLVPYAGLLGGLLVVLADVVGRVVVRPGELQVGIVLALVGGPFFVALVRRRKLVSV